MIDGHGHDVVLLFDLHIAPRGCVITKRGRSIGRTSRRLVAGAVEAGERARIVLEHLGEARLQLRGQTCPAGIVVGPALASVFRIVALRSRPTRLRRDVIPDAVAGPGLVGDKSTAIPPVAGRARMVDAKDGAFGGVRRSLALNDVHIEPDSIITAQEQVGVVNIDRTRCTRSN